MKLEDAEIEADLQTIYFKNYHDLVKALKNAKFFIVISGVNKNSGCYINLVTCVQRLKKY